MAGAMIAATASAFAQDASKVTIPFNFHAGTAQLPAGTYRIRCTTTGVLSFDNYGQRKNAFVLDANSNGQTGAPVKLVFNEYGNQYFLSKASGAHGENERVFRPTKLEKSIRAELAGLKSERQILLAAR
jgi:hypothetical protein